MLDSRPYLRPVPPLFRQRGRHVWGKRVPTRLECEYISILIIIILPLVSWGRFRRIFTSFPGLWVHPCTYYPRSPPSSFSGFGPGFAPRTPHFRFGSPFPVMGVMTCQAGNGGVGRGESRPSGGSVTVLLGTGGAVSAKWPSGALPIRRGEEPEGRSGSAFRPKCPRGHSITRRDVSGNHLLRGLRRQERASWGQA